MLTQEVCKKVYDFINRFESGVDSAAINEMMNKDGISNEDTFDTVMYLIGEGKVFIGFNSMGKTPPHLFFTDKYKNKNFKL